MQLFRWLVAAAVIVFSTHGHAQTDWTKLAERAAKLPPAPPRYIQSLKFGVRGVTFQHFALSKSDPNTFYAGSFDGFVFGSRDRGLSWQEGRLITKRSYFFGSIRPASFPSGAPFSLTGAVPRAKSIAGNRLSRMFSFDEGGDDEQACVLSDVCPDQPQIINRTNMPFAGDISIRDSAAGGGGGGDMARLGIGLTRAAVWLQALLKKKRARLIGMNLKLLLSLRGVEPTWVNHIAVHPTDPNQALVATAMGLFQTTDGGLGYIDVFTGRTNAERWNNFVEYHPKDPNVIYLGTGQGLMISRDGAESFARPTGTQLSTARTYWLSFWAKNPDIIYAGTNIGVFRSDDGGVNWRWIYYNTLPAQNYVMSVAIDPNNADRVQISTKDGLFKTSNGGKKWERSGGFLFTSIAVSRLVADPHDSNHLVCSTYYKVWETFDWGKTWNALYINDSLWSPRALAFDPHDRDVFWVQTSNELVRISSKKPPQPRVGDLESLRAVEAQEPRLHEVMDATFRNYGVHRGELSQFRSKASLQGLVPKVNAFLGVVSYANTGDMLVSLDPTSAFSRQVMLRDQRITAPYWGVMFKWDFTKLMFHQEQAPYGRYFGLNNHLFLRLRSEVQRLYEERKRILYSFLTTPPDDVRTRISLQLRLEELTAHLNSFTGGLYERQLSEMSKTPIWGSGRVKVPKPSATRQPTMTPEPKPSPPPKPVQPQKKEIKTRTLEF